MVTMKRSNHPLSDFTYKFLNSQLLTIITHRAVTRAVGKLRDDVVAGSELGGVAHDVALLQGEGVAQIQYALGGG